MVIRVNFSSPFTKPFFFIPKMLYSQKLSQNSHSKKESITSFNIMIVVPLVLAKHPLYEHFASF